MADSIIDVQGLTKRYGSYNAVDAVSFSIHKGEVVGFVGLNGAGKSTTINAILGFLHPTVGTISLFGEDVTPGNAFRSHRKIGFASGDMELFLNLTGNQYLSFVSHRYGAKDKNRLTELSERFDPDLDKKIGDLSRGNKQKIALIAAFLPRPELVILDEPSSGLDPLMQEKFLELIRIEADKGTTIFMSSHYLNEVADVCSRVLLIRSGKLVKDIPAHQLAGVGGKAVRLVSVHKVTPPKNAEQVVQEKTDDGHVLEFVYKSKAALLQQWLSGVPQLIDVTIAEHDIESAFEDLYKTDAVEVKHA